MSAPDAPPVCMTDGQTALRDARSHLDNLCGQTGPPDPDLAYAIRFTDPGETAALILGAGWRLLCENEVSIPREYREHSEVLQIQTVVVENADGALVAIRLTTLDDERHNPGRKRTYDWRGLTPVQRWNATLAAFGPAVYGHGPDGLLVGLAEAIETNSCGNDPTNWLDTARLIAAHVRATNDDALVSRFESAVFLANLGYPRFADLIGDSLQP